MRILLTGGTGSFGKAFVDKICKNPKDIERLVIFSRDEAKQWEMSQNFPRSKFPFMRYYLGDIRDSERIKLALRGINTVIHAAALKQVPAAETNPTEFIKTNVLGSYNLIQACFYSDVKKVIALSTDKASAPVNLYGATKLCADKLFISSNNLVGDSDLYFSVVRYGNVMGSRGSVIPLFMKQSKTQKYFTMTDKRMTRFNITLEDAVEMVLFSITNQFPGTILVPRLPSYRITDLAAAIDKNISIKEIGVRPGEKLHESMITSSDSYTTLDDGKYFYIANNYEDKSRILADNPTLKEVSENFEYNSFNNEDFLDVNTLSRLISNLKLNKNFSID
tara:strand:- start:4398 stop:5402 length:1005 start_codon:yes stop_codon:yes gene_type:complete